ncbi:sulfatase-like hydrolase/transferase [Akkermansiaceae bacterium]|nr:sulfatase-like hydrolase/transferase [Akkermansiaceae bacterium]
MKPLSFLTKLTPALFLFNVTLPLAVADEKKPNFIFILSDDIAQGDLGVYGQELIKTPRIDQLAKEGTRYMQAYCGTLIPTSPLTFTIMMRRCAFPETPAKELEKPTPKN